MAASAEILRRFVTGSLFAFMSARVLGIMYYVNREKLRLIGPR
jgi:hypothetical protein